MEKMEQSISPENVEVKEQLEKLLEKVDHDLLVDILQEEFGTKDATLKRDDINLVPKDDVYLVAEELKSPQAAFGYREGKPYINYYYDSKKENQYSSVQAQMHFIHCYIHEQVHATGFLKGTDDMKEDLAVFTQNTGYSFQRVTKVLKPGLGVVAAREDYFNYFSEAVTEKITQDVLWQYLERDHSFASQEDVLVYKELINQNDEGFDGMFYSVDRKILDKLIEKLAEEVNVPQESVWAAIRRGYFEEGIELFAGPEIQKGFSEVFSQDFIDHLSLHGEDSSGMHPAYLDKNYRNSYNKLFDKKIERIPDFNRFISKLASKIF